jgi:hypothetical protein
VTDHEAATPLKPMSATALAILALAGSLLGQDPGGSEAGNEEPNDPVKFMRDTLDPIKLYEPGRGTPLRVRPEPAFRLGKQAADVVQEGAIFLWLDDDGRPQAAVQVFEVRDRGAPDGIWIHEFVLLAPTPLNGEGPGTRPWSPRTPGVELRPVPDAPRPASTPAQRERQMRALARDFHASDNFHEKSWTELRLLPTPVARYGEAGSALSDGALFAFVTGTDPEAFLFLEVRPGKDGPGWQYAFAPMTCWELKGAHKGQAVWSCPLRKQARDPLKPYYVHSLPELTVRKPIGRVTP